jgi:hypothetical protein
VAKDPVLQDAVSLMGKEMWDSVKTITGGKEFFVRKDMLTDVFGVRKASIGDAWTGNTRWSPTVQKGVKNLALSVFGNDAYRYVLNSENELQGLVRSARQLIVVKSVIVPVANFISTMYQLIGRGVPLAHITRNLPKKLAEIHTYTQGRAREIELDALIRADKGKGDITAERTHTAELRSITDAYKRMSIWPLIQAGEFTAISDAGISREDSAPSASLHEH